MSHDPESTIPESEKISDENDRASDIEMRNLDMALRRVQRDARRSQEADENGVYSVTECVECGGEISEGRLQHAVKNTLCIECARARELTWRTG